MGHSTAAGIPPLAGAGADLRVEAARNATTLRLVDSMLHDARNPLNALSINLDVLTEKIRREFGEVPPAQEKNLRVMREQIHRVDGVLRQYADFIAPRVEGPASAVDVSEVLVRALGVLGHECRRSMIRVRQIIDSDLRIATTDLASVRFLALQAVFRSVARAGQEGEVEVALRREGRFAVLRVRDSLSESHEPFEHALPAIEDLCARIGAEVRRTGSEFSISMPLKLEG